MTLPTAFDSGSLPWLGLALLLFSSLHSILLRQGHPGEAGLGHVLAATVLQGLGLLVHLASPGLSGYATVANLLLIAGAGYGLWAIRRYAGLPVRVKPSVWVALGAWALAALAFRAMGFRWVWDLATPVTLAVLGLGIALELWGLAWQGKGRLPAQVCCGLVVAMGLVALVAGVLAAIFPVELDVQSLHTRAWFFFGVLGAHQFYTFMLGQVQGQRVRRRLEALVATDPLTGLASAQEFQDRLARAMGRSLRTGEPTSIMVLELDGFDAMLEEHGPAAACRVLEAFARTLTRTLRPAELSARLEGCRFAALMYQTQTMHSVLAAEHLRATWKDLQLTQEEGVFHLTLSCGVAGTQDPVADADGLLALAVARAALARQNGGDNVEGEPPLEE
jgi:diguanylate cyclase (GGDEF)-like protein